MAKSGYKRKRNEEILAIIGANIRKYRKLNGLSMEKLAMRCDMEAKAIYNYEYGKVDVSVSSIAFIAEQLGIQPFELMIKNHE